MDHHGSRIPRSRSRTPRRDPRHRIAHAPLLSCDSVPAATVFDGKESASAGPGLRSGGRRLGQEEAGRQRAGVEHFSVTKVHLPEPLRPLPNCIWSIRPLAATLAFVGRPPQAAPAGAMSVYAYAVD